MDVYNYQEGEANRGPFFQNKQGKKHSLFAPMVVILSSAWRVEGVGIYTVGNICAAKACEVVYMYK